MTMTLISTVTVGAGGASSITFSSIPSTATDLLVVLSARSSDTTTSCRIQFNGDTASNYNYLNLVGNGSTVTSQTTTTITFFSTVNGITPSGATASTFGNLSIYIPNYASSDAKTISQDSVDENNAASAVAMIQAGFWNNTAAITSINLFKSLGTFVQYSSASLYGITKGSGGATVA